MLDTVLHILLIAGGALVGGWLALLLALGLVGLLAKRGAARRWAVAGLVVAAAATGWAVAGHLRQARQAAAPPGPAQVGDSPHAAMR
jgi:hypothetical protein